MHRTLKEKLRRAYEGGEFRVHYQPKFKLETLELRGVEALLRWRNSAGTTIPPTVFIPMLEESGLICEVGAWVFERVAVDAAWWRRHDLDIGRIGINVSPVQLGRDDFMPWVLQQSAAWSAHGTAIDIELTESAVLSKPAHIAEGMEMLAGADIGFALDDFGMGYSSLDLLMRLPVSYLKIDRSFIGSMLASHKAGALVEAIVRIGDEIGLKTIAEGIETAAQLKRLRELGCAQGQGHWFCPALPREALLEWLRSRQIPKPPRAASRPDKTAIPDKAVRSRQSQRPDATHVADVASPATGTAG
jgi:EAL domain-containing protein (putative c-di-GMP-specific phosphodiesterase class I)